MAKRYVKKNSTKKIKVAAAKKRRKKSAKKATAKGKSTSKKRKAAMKKKRTVAPTSPPETQSVSSPLDNNGDRSAGDMGFDDDDTPGEAGVGENAVCDMNENDAEMHSPGDSNGFEDEEQDDEGYF